MTAGLPTPRVRLMTVCDRVRESKIEEGVFDVKGLRQRIVAAVLPFKPTRLWLLLILSSPRAGEFPGYVLVVNDRTENPSSTATWRRIPSLALMMSPMQR